MSTKTKNTKTSTDTLANVAQQAGLLLMTAAFTIGMVEVPQHSSRAVIPNQPSFAFAGNTLDSNHSDNNMRREREEAGPHYTSYNTAQRTPGRTGKV